MDEFSNTNTNINGNANINSNRTRREIIKLLTSIGAVTLLPSCASTNPTSITSTAYSVIDIHAHTFNASDLPVTRFLKEVVAELYDDEWYGFATTKGVRDPDITDRLINFLLWIIRTGKAPTGKEELKVLQGETTAETKNSDFNILENDTLQSIEAFLIKEQNKQLFEKEKSGILNNTDKADQAFFQFLLDSAGESQERKILYETNKANILKWARRLARKIYTAKKTISRYIQWIQLFKLYRYRLVDVLTSHYENSNAKPQLITPATVDYDRWLGQDVETPLLEQAKVLSEIALRETGPAVHSYIAFDPLREVYHQYQQINTTTKKREVSSQVIIETALNSHGAIGVKLYPPMGFKPTANDNQQGYQERICKELFNDDPDNQKYAKFSENLNKALENLYTYCAHKDKQIPILTHAYDSAAGGCSRTNGHCQDNKKYSNRADPHYWLPVLEQHPTLRVCLAHFGSFDTVSEAYGPPADNSNSSRIKHSWEAVIGHYVKSHPQSQLYADISYLSQVLTRKKAPLELAAEGLIYYREMFDNECEHLLFGSDWMMLGQEPNHRFYIQYLIEFLDRKCNFSEKNINNILNNNAIRFLGISKSDTQNSKTRQRLKQFYQRKGKPHLIERLPG